MPKGRPRNPQTTDAELEWERHRKAQRRGEASSPVPFRDDPNRSAVEVRCGVCGERAGAWHPIISGSIESYRILPAGDHDACVRRRLR